MIGEYNTSGVMQRRTVHGPAFDEPVFWYEGSGTSDRRWLVADQLGSIIAAWGPTITQNGARIFQDAEQRGFLLMDEASAKQIDRLARQAQGHLNEILLVARAGCSEAEFIQLRSVVGSIMGALVIDVLQPLYAEHPQIVPPELQ